MSLLSTQNLSKEYVLRLIKQASELQKKDFSEKPLKDKLVATLFYEASTRTRASFEIAAKRLGAEVVNLDPSIASVQKGETLEDTARTLADLGTDLVVIRHPSSGAAYKLNEALKNTKVQVINAGDGMNEHPSQALLDLLSIMETTSSIEGKKIAIIGDSLHSRVARSNIYLLQKFGAQINLVGPPGLVARDFEALGVKVFYDLNTGIKNANYLIVLRLQKERQAAGLIPSLEEYHKFFGISYQSIENAGLNLKEIKLLHPGPVNRGIEIDSDLVDNDSVSLVHRQVYNGLYVRMSILMDLLGNNLNKI